MHEMHLKQPGFTYSASGSFTKNKERIGNFMQTGATNCIYRNDLNKACFQHDMAYGKYKDLTKRTQSDNVLRDKIFEIAGNPQYNGYQRGLASMVFKFFDKKSKGSGIKSMSNQHLAERLHKPMLILLICKGIRYLLCVIDIFSKYAWVVPLKDKKISCYC